MKWYTGVGSRKTPLVILQIMRDLAFKLDKSGYVLRSGGADGADSAFASGTDHSAIFRPSHVKPNSPPYAIAKAFHPAWERCGDYVRKLHARNAFQVLGYDLVTPSDFLVCWTPDGACTHQERSIKTGGTGTAISIAHANNIKVFNMARPDHADRVIDYI